MILLQFGWGSDLPAHLFVASEAEGLPLVEKHDEDEVRVRPSGFKAPHWSWFAAVDRDHY